MGDYEDDNDLDNWVDRNGDENDDLEALVPEAIEEAEEIPVKNDAEEKRVVPVKIRVKKPQPKLNPERLRGPRGLSILQSWFDNVQLKGKGHEVEDLNAVMNRLEQWTHRLFPRYTFDDAIDKLEKLGKKNEVKVMLKRLRMDMDFNEEVVTQLDTEINESPNQQDPFDRIANSVDIFPISSTSSIGNSGLTEEQRQRMMHNRMLAEERRQTKIRARQEKEKELNNMPLNENTSIQS
ncbi:TIMELESS-interacting protein [Daktulosphaira vitifoliae]|uniref:TIMELESS-interacting protein n=1 Tax=Daktulosphaira vitifoliae TaxID=58002 RepID=UPI0021AB05C9|nr:TIMELESS-interacting protein [Daktulosphaira vitifoliae]